MKTLNEFDIYALDLKRLTPDEADVMQQLWRTKVENNGLPDDPVRRIVMGSTLSHRLQAIIEKARP